MPNLDDSIRTHAESLRTRHPQVRDCRVSIEDRPPHEYERRRYNVRLDIALAGRALVVNREHDADPSVALADAFAAAARQLDTLDA